VCGEKERIQNPEVRRREYNQKQKGKVYKLQNREIDGRIKYTKSTAPLSAER